MNFKPWCLVLSLYSTQLFAEETAPKDYVSLYRQGFSEATAPQKVGQLKSKQTWHCLNFVAVDPQKNRVYSKVTYQFRSSPYSHAEDSFLTGEAFYFSFGNDDEEAKNETPAEGLGIYFNQQTELEIARGVFETLRFGADGSLFIETHVDKKKTNPTLHPDLTSISHPRDWAVEYTYCPISELGAAPEVAPSIQQQFFSTRHLDLP